ncbi:MAG: hypothetical protein ACREFP_11055 [Acetobacteraceae bacterium]
MREVNPLAYMPRADLIRVQELVQLDRKPTGTEDSTYDGKCNSVEFDIALILRQLALASTLSAGRVAQHPTYRSERDHRCRCGRRFVATLARRNQFLLRSRQHVAITARELVCYPTGNLGLHRINRARFHDSELCAANSLLTFHVAFSIVDFKGNEGLRTQL